MDTISSGGYDCIPKPDVTSVLVVSGLSSDPGFLDDFLQAYLEKLLVSVDILLHTYRVHAYVYMCTVKITSYDRFS